MIDHVRNSQAIQADQYAFPYHYIPEAQKRIYLSRHWGFAPSYMAALGLVATRLQPVADEAGKQWRHIDIGCGDGALVHHLSMVHGLAEGQISGVDIDTRAITWARMFSPHADFYASDMTELAGGYHSASLVEVMEHIPPDDLPNFMTEAARLLTPGGLLVVTVPSIEKSLASKHFQHFSFESIRSAIEPDFDNVAVYGFEQTDVVCRIIGRLRINPLARIDAPFLNRLLVKKLSRLRQTQIGCGRLFVTAQRKA